MILLWSLRRSTSEFVCPVYVLACVTTCGYVCIQTLCGVIPGGLVLAGKQMLNCLSVATWVIVKHKYMILYKGNKCKARRSPHLQIY